MTAGNIEYRITNKFFIEVSIYLFVSSVEDKYIMTTILGTSVEVFVRYF